MVGDNFLWTSQTMQPPADPGGNQIVPTPPEGGDFNPDPGDIGTIPMPGGPTPPGTPRTPGEANPNAFWSDADKKQLLIWAAALGGLWLFLSMLADTGNQRFAYGLAALVLGGALIYMAPDRNGQHGAFYNAQHLFD